MNIEKMMERIYKNYCLIIEIFDADGVILARFPVDENESLAFTKEDIIRNKWGIRMINTDIREAVGINYLTDIFWTCKCKDHFLRHAGDSSCKKCNTHWKQKTTRIPTLNIKEMELFNNTRTSIN